MAVQIMTIDPRAVIQAHEAKAHRTPFFTPYDCTEGCDDESTYPTMEVDGYGEYYHRDEVDPFVIKQKANLYHSRALAAHYKAHLFSAFDSLMPGEYPRNINTRTFATPKARRMLPTSEWIDIWLKVERRCLDYAELLDKAADNV